MTVLYFTATGNDLYLAKRIGGELVSIPKSIKEGNYHFSDDKIGLVFPIYFLSVPDFIEAFLKKTHLESRYIFAVMSYGGYPGAASAHLIKISKQCGINFSYINTIKMVDNWLPMFNIEKEIKIEPKKQIETHLGKILSDIAGSKQWIIKDSIIKKMVSMIYPKFNIKPTEGISRTFYVQDTCTSCAVCAKVCPVDNIKLQSGKPEFGTACINCLACIHNCPKSSIRFKGEKNAARFRNRHVSLNEIITANE